METRSQEAIVAKQLFGKSMYTLPIQLLCVLAIGGAALCAACHARTAAERESSGPPPRTATLGPRGGRVHGPNGAQAVLPPGALERETRVELVLPPVGSTPPLPPYLATVGPTYAFGPRDLRLAQAATISIPFDSTQVPSRTAARLYAADPDDATWHEVAAAYASDGHINAPASAPASFVVVVAHDSIPTAGARP
jgi:hypothetical protein